jgi:hypothetical protein
VRASLAQSTCTALDRIAAKLGELEHLEEGALLFYATLVGRDHPAGVTRAQRWLEAERKRRP